MKAKLLPIAMGAILAGGMTVANADVTVFGHIDTSIDSVDVDGGEDDITLNCTTCSVGFKGSEDLGNGLKAIFKLDFQYDTINRNQASSNTNSLLDRDQWFGLAGSGFGSVKVGTISTLYKSHGAMIDPLYRTSLQGRSHGLQSSFHTGAGEELQGRATNTIRWDSPSYNGVKLGATYTLDSGNSEPAEENPFGIGGSYSNGGILVFADYLDNNQSGTTEETVWKIGGKYSMDDIAVMAQYEDAEEGSLDAQVWHVAGSFTMGNNMIYLGYGQGDGPVTNSDYDAWTLAGVHSMSKRTSVYAGFTQADCDASAGSGGGSPGDGFGVCDDSGNINGESDQFSIGMKHKF